MSSRSLTDVYQEKRIAAYEGWFKESSFSKPQNVYLTITVGHLFGEAYIMEQEGTKEGDPVYQRFVCPLEEVTKVYVNDNVKSSPLFIQCDTDIKGVIHRKRIIIPCLENVHDIVSEIERVHAAHMEKIEASVARARKKSEEKKKEYSAEQSTSEARELAPSAAPVDKIKFDPLIPASIPRKKKVETPAPEPEVKKDACILDEDMEKDLAALEKISSSLESAGDSIETITPAPRKRPSKVKPAAPDDVPELDVSDAPVLEQKPDVHDELESVLTDALTEAQNILVSEAEQTAEKIEDSVEAIESKKRIRLPKVTSITEDEVASIDLPDVTDIPDAVRSVYNELPDIKDISEPEPVPEPVYQQEAVEPVQEPAPVSGVSGSLAEFETAMRDLKRRKAEGLISDSEFAAEKKKLMQMI